MRGREQRRCPAIVRRSRKQCRAGSYGYVPDHSSLEEDVHVVIKTDATAHCVGQEVMKFSSACPGGVNIKCAAAWVCGLDHPQRR